MHSRVIHDSSWRVNHSSLARETGRGIVVRTSSFHVKDTAVLRVTRF